MGERRRIVGPLGWHYPILNAILEFFEQLRERRMARLERFGSKRSTRPSTPPLTYHNIEEYEIFEDKQGVIKVRVHRRARRGS